MVFLSQYWCAVKCCFRVRACMWHAGKPIWPDTHSFWPYGSCVQLFVWRHVHSVKPLKRTQGRYCTDQYVVLFTVHNPVGMCVCVSSVLLRLVYLVARVSSSAHSTSKTSPRHKHGYTLQLHEKHLNFARTKHFYKRAVGDISQCESDGVSPCVSQTPISTHHTNTHLIRVWTHAVCIRNLVSLILRQRCMHPPWRLSQNALRQAHWKSFTFHIESLIVWCRFHNIHFT